MTGETSPEPAAPAPTSRRWLAGCGGAALALLCVAVYWFLTLGPRLPAVTPADLDAASARWQSQRPADYDLEVRVAVQDTAVFAVKVRGGSIVEATRDGRPQDPRTWSTWDVSGMFITIADDLRANAGGPGPGAQPAGNLVLRGEFDPVYGYPRRYQRIQLNPASEVRFEVLKFQPKGL